MSALSRIVVAVVSITLAGAAFAQTVRLRGAIEEVNGNSAIPTGGTTACNRHQFHWEIIANMPATGHSKRRSHLPKARSRSILSTILSSN